MARVIVALTLVLAPLALGSGAVASCAPPASVAENAQRADAVVHGRIVRFEGTAPPGAPGRLAVLDVMRVLKGSVPARITVSLGPVVGGGGGGVVATSVDYRAEVGTDHTLYVKRSAGTYETNECVGTHPGAPSAEEARVLGPGGPPQGGAPRAEGATATPGGPGRADATGALDAAVIVAAIALAVGLGGVSVLYVLRKRRSVV